jgi:hypothetical protein
MRWNGSCIPIAIGTESKNINAYSVRQKLQTADDDLFEAIILQNRFSLEGDVAVKLIERSFATDMRPIYMLARPHQYLALQTGEGGMIERA